MPDRRKHADNQSRGGADTLLTTARADAAVAAAKLALPKNLIAKLLGVQRSTFFYWLQLGRDGEGQYADFYRRFRQAEGEAAHTYLGIVADSAAGGRLVSRTTKTSANGAVEVSERWTSPNAAAAQWVLERRFAREFGPNRLEVQLLEAQVKELADRLAKLAGLEEPAGEAGPAATAGGGGKTDAAPDARADSQSGDPGGAQHGGGGIPFEL